MNKQTLEKILSSPRLPTLPAVAMQVLELTRQTPVDLDEVARVVRNDQALAAKVLRTVNSSYYGLTKPCTTIRQAIVYLGLNTVKSLVLGFSLVDSIAGDADDVTFDFVDYWRRGLFSAVAAREIVELGRCGDPENAFLAALMQDIGMVAMFRVLGDQYLQVIDMAQGDHRRLASLERKSFDLDHAAVGAEIARKWRLPSIYVDAIEHHHDWRSSTHSAGSQARAVEAANLAALTLMPAQAESVIAQFRREMSDWLNLDSVSVKRLLSEITQAADELKKLFRLNVGARPDVEAIMAQAEEQVTAHHAEVARQTHLLQQSNAQLAEQVLCDPLTSLMNRRGFDELFHRLFAEHRGNGRPVSLIFCDIDRFKPINDAHHHVAGDAVLMEVSRRLGAIVGGRGMVCRYGGEEFAIVLSGSDRVAATRLAEELRRGIEATPVTFAGGPTEDLAIAVTMSFGVATRDETTGGILSEPQFLVRVADEAMYAAKAGGRNCVRVFHGHVKLGKVAA